MIALLKGTIYDSSKGSITLLVNGVGYKVEAAGSLQAHLEGEEVTAYIYTHVREDAIKLFGFASKDELETFENLLSVSGVGPKGAMSIISTLGVDGVWQGIMSEDPKVFSGVTGIGKKNAEKIILELKSKSKTIGSSREVASEVIVKLDKQKEFEEALISLGYSLGEIRRIEPKIDFSTDISATIRSGLQLLH